MPRQVIRPRSIELVDTTPVLPSATAFVPSGVLVEKCALDYEMVVHQVAKFLTAAIHDAPLQPE
jgi:hypothetical protein